MILLKEGKGVLVQELRDINWYAKVLTHKNNDLWEEKEIIKSNLFDSYEDTGTPMENIICINEEKIYYGTVERRDSIKQITSQLFNEEFGGSELDFRSDDATLEGYSYDLKELLSEIKDKDLFRIFENILSKHTVKNFDKGEAFPFYDFYIELDTDYRKVVEEIMAVISEYQDNFSEQNYRKVANIVDSYCETLVDMEDSIEIYRDFYWSVKNWQSKIRKQYTRIKEIGEEIQYQNELKHLIYAYKSAYLIKNLSSFNVLGVHIVGNMEVVLLEYKEDSNFSFHIPEEEVENIIDTRDLKKLSNIDQIGDRKISKNEFESSFAKIQSAVGSVKVSNYEKRYSSKNYYEDDYDY